MPLLFSSALRFSFLILLCFVPHAVWAQNNHETVRQSMHCSVQAESHTAYPHKGKTKGLAYGILAGIGAGIATSGASTFFYIMAAGVGIGAGFDHVDYKDQRAANYRRCLNTEKNKPAALEAMQKNTAEPPPVPDFATPISDEITPALPNSPKTLPEGI